MPAGLIEQDDRVCTRRYFGCDLVEMELHGFGARPGRYLPPARGGIGRRGTSSARVESAQTTGAMHHGIFLGGNRLGVRLQDAAGTQETDGHRGAVGQVVIPAFRK
jgi:hypothetical protein